MVKKTKRVDLDGIRGEEWPRGKEQILAERHRRAEPGGAGAAELLQRSDKKHFGILNSCSFVPSLTSGIRPESGLVLPVRPLPILYYR